MKKIKFLAFLMFIGTGVMMTSCDDDDDDDVVADTTATVTFEGDYFSALIDDQQYGGDLLYGDDANSYSWTDETTTLTGGMTLAWGGYYGYAEGGSAISNYIDDNVEEHGTYTYQLAVPASNGSDNFVVVYCDATISFADGTARVIQSMDVCPTTYLLSCELYGGSYASALTDEGSYYTITMTADNGASIDVDFARDGDLLQTWKTVDLSSLGAITSLTFTATGSDSSYGYINTPAYFAFDNVVVEL